MKIRIVKPPVTGKKARIEIIPLIDIMFFLLASFMLVSLSMIRLQGMQMTLPSRNTPPPPPSADRPEILTVQILADGQLVYVSGPNKAIMTTDQILAELSKRFEQDKKDKKDTRVFINADKAAQHGMVIEMLDKVKGTGITKVTFSLKPQTLTAPAPGAAPVPGAPAPAPAPATPPTTPNQ